MRSKILKYSLIAITILLVGGCNEDDLIEKDLRLRHKGADMPIFIRGNLSSGKLLLFLHGGPGDCAMCYRYYLEPIEKEYAIAYWDQRVAGASTGNVDKSTLSYNQFLEDTELVIMLLKDFYPNVDLYLMGHSFGVELGWQFLTTGHNQQMVDGFIAINGIYSSFEWMNSMREFVLKKAVEQNNNQALQFAISNEVNPATILNYPWTDLYKYMLDLGGNPVSVYDDTSFLIDYLFSPNYLFAQFTHGKYYDDVVNTDALLFEKGDKLDEITIPVGLFWGTLDGVVPFQNALKTQELLINTEVELVRFDGSWHEPFISQNYEFVTRVINYLETH